MRQPLPISQLTLSIGRWPNLILGDAKNSEYYSWKYRKIEIRLHNFVYSVVYSQARTDVPSGLLILFFTLLSTNKTMNCLYFKNIYKKTVPQFHCLLLKSGFVEYAEAIFIKVQSALYCWIFLPEKAAEHRLWAEFWKEPVK